MESKESPTSNAAAPPVLACSVVLPDLLYSAPAPEFYSALGRQTLPRDQFEILAVCGGTSASAAAELKAQLESAAAGRLTFEYQPEQNAAQRRNTAVRAACGEVLVFIGQGLVLDPECLARLIAGVRQTEQPRAVCGLVEIPRIESCTVLTRLLFDERFLLPGVRAGHKQRVGPEEFSTALLSLPRSLLVQNRRQFDEQLLSSWGADFDVGYQLCSEGTRTVFDDSARAGYRGNMTPAQFMTEQIARSKDIVRMILRNPELTVRFLKVSAFTSRDVIVWHRMVEEESRHMPSILQLMEELAQRESLVAAESEAEELLKAAAEVVRQFTDYLLKRELVRRLLNVPQLNEIIYQGEVY